MRKLSFTFYFLLLFITVVAQEADTATNRITAQLDEYLSSATKLYKFNGNALVAQKGKILLQKSYGYKNAAIQTLNDSNTVFQIASVTKQFTAAIILKLQEQGKLSVKDQLGKYFPVYKYGAAITIENLLTHTSGIYNYTNDIDENDSAIVCNPVTKERVLEIFFTKPLAFKPGSKFQYCNSGYYLLGMIIEKITGKPYEQVMRELIFEPLQMNNSGFNFRVIADDIKATGYKTFTEKEQLIAQRWDSTVTYAAGGILSTSSDLYKWAKAVAGKQLLQEDSWEQVFTPHLDHYGYGWWTDSLYGKRTVLHSGGMPGFMSYLTYYPDDDVSIILLSNNGNYGQSLVSINGALSAIVFNKPYNLIKESEAIHVDESILKQYTGRYEFDKKHPAIVSLENGSLQIEAPAGGLPKTPMYAESEQVFFLKNIEVKIEFVKDVDGKVIHLIAHSNGKNEVCKKVK